MCLGPAAVPTGPGAHVTTTSATTSFRLVALPGESLDIPEKHGGNVIRRICLVGVAIVAGSLVVGGGLAGAASTSTGTSAVKSTVLACKISMTTTPPAGSNVVLLAPRGNQYGPTHCSAKGFGPAAMADSFTVPDSGDTVGTYYEYFRAGTVYGKFDLTPLPGSGISSSSFQSQSWTGTLTVTGGTGIYKGIAPIKGKKGVGTMKCASPDSVHVTCNETVQVGLPPGFKP